MVGLRVYHTMYYVRFRFVETFSCTWKYDVDISVYVRCTVLLWSLQETATCYGYAKHEDVW